MEIYGLCEKNKRLSIYKINSIEWDGEEYKGNGILCRNYTLEGEVLADEDVVTIKKVGVFSRLINNHPAAVTFGALTVLIVISCVVVFLVFLKRRQMNKYVKY